MINVEFLDISGDQVPVSKIYSFEGPTFVFRFKFNSLGFFTVEIYDATNRTFLFSNILNYDSNIIDSLLAPITSKIIPLNIKILKGDIGTEEITEETLGNDIRLYLNITEDELNGGT